MSNAVKVTFNGEIRRVSLASSSNPSFDSLVAEIRASFTNISQSDSLELRWKDQDGDLISFSSDSELKEALRSVDKDVFESQCLKVFVEVKQGGFASVSDNDRASARPNRGHPPFMRPPMMGGHPGMRGGNNPMMAGGGANQVLSEEEKTRLKQIAEKVSEASRKEANEIAGPMAGEYAADMTKQAILSVVKKAMMIEKHCGGMGGAGPPGMRRGGAMGGGRRPQYCSHNAAAQSKHPRTRSHSGSESSSSSDSEAHDKSVETVNRIKQGRASARHLNKLATTEVSAAFGAMAGKHAGREVRHCFIGVVKQALRVNKQTAAPADPKKKHSAPIKDKAAIDEAIKMFKEMGYEPDDWLINTIEEANGNISAVFQKLKPNN